MHRARVLSPPALVDQLLDRHAQGMAVAEHLEPLYRFASAIGGGALDRHEASNRTPMLGDREPFAACDPLEQGGQMGLGLIGADFAGHFILRLVLHQSNYSDRHLQTM